MMVNSWHARDFDIGHASMSGATFHRMLADLRERGPVVDVGFYGRPAKLITRYDALQQAFRDEDRFPPETSYQQSTEPVVGRTFISMPQKEHNVYRKLAAPFFNRGAISSLEDEGIRGLCHQLLDPLLQAGGGDLVAQFTRPLPLLVIGRMLGLPTEDNIDLQRWAMALLSFPVDPSGALAASAQFSGFLLPIIQQRRREPGDDVISALIQSRIDDRLLSDEDIASHIRLLFPTGADTTFLALGNLIHALHSQPDGWVSLVEDPTLIPGAVEELLRWESPTPLIPRVSSPTSSSAFGTNFEPHTPVLFGIGAANRDPAVFKEPDRFDIHRSPARILTFGPGLRTCPGMHLARKEMKIALEVLIERCPQLLLNNQEEAQPVGTILRGPQALRIRVR